MLDAISGAHIYGKNIIQAEGFTEVRGTWDETPALLKPLLDRNYCLGVNSIVFHVCTHNPWTDRRPGMTLDGIGTFFQRDNTWWREMPVFTQYITRCQQYLQSGTPVVDLAVYIGDETPRRAILPERLADILPGLLGDVILQREKLRLANDGQPMETSPVGVSHTRNMTKAEDWINPLHGYKYDSFNHHTLDGMTVEGGEIVTRDGMRYKAIVVPQARKMNPDNINTGQEKLEQLRRQGAQIIEQPWTETDMASIGLLPDVVLPSGVDFTHRHTDDEDIYFFSNQTGHTITFSPQCRAQRAHSCLYDPLTDETVEYDGTIMLAPWGSVFCRLTDQPMATNTMADSINSGLITLDSPWHLTFEENGLETDTPLVGWEQMENPQMRYYSGHVTYTNTFKYRGKSKKAWLTLGEVCDIATVYVNGVCCGTAWTEPYGMDISHALRKGKNDIRIEVVNTWANALRGSDEGMPPFDGIWTNGKYRLAEKALLPAGLLGPVIIITN